MSQFCRESVETSGVVIAVQRDGNGRISSLDVFTEDHGIMRWFNRAPLDDGRDYTFEDVEISGERATATAGKSFVVNVSSNNMARMAANGSQGDAKFFVDVLRGIVFDGVPLDRLFAITKQAIRNFVAEHNAAVVLLKALYLVCREEGYAVDAIWLDSLPNESKSLARGTIAAPLGGNFPEGSSGAIRPLAESLGRWMLSL
jgi:hypothetical protein